MPGNLSELLDMALALSRADRQALVERLRESLEEPDVPGGIIVTPQDLVKEGALLVDFGVLAAAQGRAEDVAL